MVSSSQSPAQKGIQLKGTTREDPLSPTTSARSPTALAKNTKCVRKELLYKLGFENNGAVPALPLNRGPARPLLGQVQTTTEPLKYDKNFDKVMLEKKERARQRRGSNNVFSALGSLFSPQQTEDATRDDVDSFKASSPNSVVGEALTTGDQSSKEGTKKPRRGLSFNDQVTVVPIPERHEYSKRIRDRLWVNAQELQSQAARNTVEFASEGWDWRNAFLDEEMYVCAVTGEKVHPVHLESDS